MANYFIKTDLVTIICNDEKSVERWIKWLVERGDAPAITKEEQCKE